ncbi:hypothetical protein GGI05_002914, partial [Coemansia sp. RSA 2603]
MKHYVRLWLLFVGVQFLCLYLVYRAFHSLQGLGLRATVFDWLSRQSVYPCAFRKLPALFEHGDEYYYVVWETTCPLGSPRLKWWTGENDAEPSETQVIDPWYKRLDGNHHRYTAIFGPVGDASKVHYHIKNYRLSTKTFTIRRPAPSETQRILVIADNQNEPTRFRKILSSARTYYGKSSKPDYIMHVGDSVQNVWKLKDWQNQFFAPMDDTCQYHHSSPLIFVPGNHDHDKSRKPNNKNYYTDMYHGITDSEGLSKKVVDNGTYHRFFHSLAIGSARMIVLDSECPSTEQTEFLKRELESPAFREAQFRIVSIHIPPFIEFWDPYTWNEKGEKHWGEHVRLEYDPLFRQHGVDLVISGHQHNYQRATVRRSSTDNDTALNQMTYTIVGGAGGGLDLQRVEDWH